MHLLTGHSVSVFVGDHDRRHVAEGSVENLTD